MAGFLVLLLHVDAGLAHRFDNLVERDLHVRGGRPQGKPGRVDGLDRADTGIEAGRKDNRVNPIATFLRNDLIGSDVDNRVLAHIDQRDIVARHGFIEVDLRTHPPRGERIVGAHLADLVFVLDDRGNLVAHELRRVGIALFVEQQVFIGHQHSGRAGIPLLFKPLCASFVAILLG